MKQNQNQNQSESHSSSSFVFDDRQISIGKRSGHYFERIKPKKNFDGYPRLSEYPTYHNILRESYPSETSQQSLPRTSINNKIDQLNIPHRSSIPTKQKKQPFYAGVSPIFPHENSTSRAINQDLPSYRQSSFRRVENSERRSSMRTYRAIIDELNKQENDKVKRKNNKELVKDTNLTFGNENYGINYEAEDNNRRKEKSLKHKSVKEKQPYQQKVKSFQKTEEEQLTSFLKKFSLKQDEKEEKLEKQAKEKGKRSERLNVAFDLSDHEEKKKKKKVKIQQQFNIEQQKDVSQQYAPEEQQKNELEKYVDKQIRNEAKEKPKRKRNNSKKARVPKEEKEQADKRRKRKRQKKTEQNEQKQIEETKQNEQVKVEEKRKRSKRVRTKPLQFWKGEKIHYKDYQAVSIVSATNFFQLIRAKPQNQKMEIILVADDVGITATLVIPPKGSFEAFGFSHPYKRLLIQTEYKKVIFTDLVHKKEMTKHEEIEVKSETQFGLFNSEKRGKKKVTLFLSKQ